jgi:hypothetical protein
LLYVKLELTAMRLLGGTPFTSMIKANYSFSSSPAKRGNPTKSSYRMHPKLHISIAAE